MSTSNGREEGRRRIVAPKIGAATGTNSWFMLIPIWLGSAVIQLSLLGIFFLIAAITGPASAESPRQVENFVETTIQEESPSPDLSNIDLGENSQLRTNYNNTKIAEISVPGERNDNETVGLVNAQDAIPRSIPLPPGVLSGTGAAPDSGAPGGTGQMVGTPGGMGGMFSAGGIGGRSGATREQMLTEGGGNHESEAAVARGLAWLAAHQGPDGRWSLHKFPEYGRDKAGQLAGKGGCGCTGVTGRHNDPAATGLALLPFLGAGHTQRPLADKAQVDYSKTVMLGLKYLMSIQARDGYLGGDTEMSNMYGHAIAAIALCEAYGMTNEPSLRGPAQRAVTFIVNAQTTSDPGKGGWRYVPKQDGDTSVTGWQMMALKSGQMAGLSVPAKAFTAADEFLEQCKVEVPANNGTDKKLIAYCYRPGTDPSRTMTAVALLCREYLGVNPKNPDLLRGVEYVKQEPPAATDNLYYLYYATQVFHHMGGATWQFWNLGPDGSGKGGIRDTLIRKQDKGTNKQVHQMGSWSPIGDNYVNDGGRIMWTSLSLLTLEVYYRHLPLYGRDLGTMKDNSK